MKKLLTTEAGITVVIALVMLNNIEHLAWVHHDIARHVFTLPWMNWAHSIMVVVIIELAIIVLVRRGMDVFAGVYTLMLLVLTLLYYPLDQYWQSGEYGRFIAAVVYSLMFVLSIYYFARMAADKTRAAQKESDYKDRWHQANRLRESLQGKLRSLEDELRQKQSEISSGQGEIKRLQGQIKERESELLKYKSNFLLSERSRILKKKPENRTSEEAQLLKESEILTINGK